MLLWHSPLRSCCSHSHLLLLLLHLVLQELQLSSGEEEEWRKQTKKKCQQGISVRCYKQHSTCVAWVSEAELKPAETYKKKMSVQRNTEGWLMGCRGEGKEDSGAGWVRGRVQSSSTRGALETNHWL